MAVLLCGLLGEGPLPSWLLVTCPGHHCASLCVAGIVASKLSLLPGWVAMVSLLSRFHAIETHFSHCLISGFCGSLLVSVMPPFSLQASPHLSAGLVCTPARSALGIASETLPCSMAWGFCPVEASASAF